MTLSAEQKQALQEGAAVRVTESETRTECVLIRADVYEGLRAPADSHGEFDVPTGIRSAQDAFRRDLPALLRDHEGQWALYQGDQRLGISRTERELLAECLRRRLKSDEYYLEKIAPYVLDELEGQVEFDPSFVEADEIEASQ